MSNNVSLVWFRQDLRLADNPALQAAIARAGAVVPVYIWAPDEENNWAPGAASRLWLHHSLLRLSEQIRATGNELIIRSGPSLEILLKLVRETGANAVFWNRRYEPAIIARDRKLKENLRSAGLEVESFNAALLHEPWTIKKKGGGPFQVFTPFWRTCLGLAEPAKPAAAPKQFASFNKKLKSVPIEELELHPEHSSANGIETAWYPGAAAAEKELKRFLSVAFLSYDKNRDIPGTVGTSRLSPYLHFGEIGPRQIWDAFKRESQRRGLSENEWRNSTFLRELGWREFSHHLLYHFPTTPEQPLRSEFARFPWRREPSWLKAWQRGETGYPMVDAGMRELWTTGWMHNRVRMIVASFLVKHLLISWQSGARWFWDTLVDADLAQNTLGWQWTAGCGADAAPYFRIFNPVIQGERYDPQGKYVRRWVPEIKQLPDKWVHQPWTAPDGILENAGVTLDRTYPRPIVSHAIAREVALDALNRMKTHRLKVVSS